MFSIKITGGVDDVSDIMDMDLRNHEDYKHYFDEVDRVADEIVAKYNFDNK